jgi:hypothetical protein
MSAAPKPSFTQAKVVNSTLEDRVKPGRTDRPQNKQNRGGPIVETQPAARSAAEAARWRTIFSAPLFPWAAVKDELEMQMIVIELLNHEAFHIDWVRGSIGDIYERELDCPG